MKPRAPASGLSAIKPSSLLHLLIFCIFMQKISIIGHAYAVVRYKYSFYEYLYDFCAEAQQTASSLLHL
jgi:hypothetical protein